MAEPCIEIGYRFGDHIRRRQLSVTWAVGIVVWCKCKKKRNNVPEGQPVLKPFVFFLMFTERLCHGVHQLCKQPQRIQFERHRNRFVFGAGVAVHGAAGHCRTEANLTDQRPYCWSVARSNRTLAAWLHDGATTDAGARSKNTRTVRTRRQTLCALELATIELDANTIATVVRWDIRHSQNRWRWSQLIDGGADAMR